MPGRVMDEGMSERGGAAQQEGCFRSVTPIHLAQPHNKTR